MKKLTSTVIALLCFFLSSRAQKPAETNKSSIPNGMETVKKEEKLHIAHLQFHAQVDEADHFQNGRLKIAGQLSRKPDSPVKTVLLLEGGGQRITRELFITDSLFELEIPVINPLLWSSESPYLYTLWVKLQGNDGKAAEVISRRVGFRQVLLRDGLLWVNGRRIWIKGINLHEPDPVTGQILSPGSLLPYIRVLKSYHINAIRASRGADDTYLCELCDAEGFYVQEEANMPDQDHPCLIPRSERLWENESMSGNSLGGFANAWDTIRSHRATLQGGYCWDFAGPEGIFDIIGRAKPAAAELKKSYQDILTSLAKPLPHPPSTKAGNLVSSAKAPVIREMPVNVTIRVFNDHVFTNLSNIALEWEVLVNGLPGSKGTIPELSIAPQQSRDLRLPVKIPTGAGDEVFLNIRYTLKKQEPMLPAGQLIAQEQLLLKKANAIQLTVVPKGELSFTDEDGAFTISCPVAGAYLRFNKQTGWLQQYTLKGVALLDDTLGLKTNFWRAPTDRDYAAELPRQLSAWQRSTKEPHLQLFSTSTASDLIIVRADYTLPETFCNLHIRYTINAQGEILTDQVLEVDTTLNTTGPGAGSGSGLAMARDTTAKDTANGGPMLPRFGMQWILPAGFDSIVYYGSGPQENYSDRNYGAQKGIYRQTVQEQFFPYMHPQETGTKTNIRWWKITDRHGFGLLITADSALLSMSALHYFDSDLDDGDNKQQRHAGDPRPRPQTQLSIDRCQMGIGGIDTWDSIALPSYRLPYGNYQLTYKISPIPPAH